MEEDADQPILIPLDQDLEGPLDVVADLEHQPDVGVARLQLLFQGLDAPRLTESLPRDRPIVRHSVASAGDQDILSATADQEPWRPADPRDRRRS